MTTQSNSDKKPKTEAKPRLSLRINHDLLSMVDIHLGIKSLAKRKRKTRNAWIMSAIKSKIKSRPMLEDPTKQSSVTLYMDDETSQTLEEIIEQIESLGIKCSMNKWITKAIEEKLEEEGDVKELISSFQGVNSKE